MAENAPSSDKNVESPHILVVGGGIAAVSACETLRTTAPQAQVTLVAREPDVPYYRLNLTRYLADEIPADQLPLHPEPWYEQQNIRLIQDQTVDTVDLAAHTATLSDGQTVEFDKLILATGAEAFIPPIHGSDKPNVTPIRTRSDVAFILDAASNGARCVVVGGGVLGLETAGGLLKRGAAVSLICSGQWVMERELTEQAGLVMNEHVAEMGVDLHFNSRAEGIVGDGQAEGVALADGTVVPADLVIFATGIAPNVALAKQMGLTVDRGVVVDDRLGTSHPDVLAAGDVAEHNGVVEGLWMPARQQGQVAAKNALGTETPYTTSDHAVILKIIPLNAYSVGQFKPDEQCTVVAERADGKYYHFVFREGKLVGAILLGDARRGARVKRAMDAAVDFADLLAGEPTAAAVMVRVMGK